MKVIFFLFRNCITELCTPLCLPEIKLLDVSKNGVENISADFLRSCPKLETLNVSMNKLCGYYQLTDELHTNSFTVSSVWVVFYYLNIQ